MEGWSRLAIFIFASLLAPLLTLFVGAMIDFGSWSLLMMLLGALVLLTALLWLFIRGIAWVRQGFSEAD